MEGIISWWAGVSEAFVAEKHSCGRVPRSKSRNHERPVRISECLPVQTQQTDLQPLVDSSYLVTVTLITLHSCPLHAAPTLSKALTLPPSPSSLLPHRSARRGQWIRLVFIPLLLWWRAYSTHQTRRIFLSLAPSTGRLRGPSDLFPLLFWQSGASSFWSANTAELLPTRWCQQTPANTEAEFTVSNRPELIPQSSSWSQRELGWG